MPDGYRCLQLRRIEQTGAVPMAKRTIQMLVDDVDGTEADETVRFGIDGIQYEIDLSKTNAEKMRGVLARYVEAGAKVGRAGAPGTRTAPARGQGSAGPR